MNGKKLYISDVSCVTVCTPFVISIRWKTFARCQSTGRCPRGFD